MSAMLKTLKKSEQGYKTLQTAQKMHQNQSKFLINTDRKKAWLLFILFISPSLVLIILLSFLHQGRLQASQAIAERVMDTVILPYPYTDTSELKDLPEPAPREVILVSARESNKENDFNQYASLITEQNSQTSQSSRSTNSVNKVTQATTINKPVNREPVLEDIDLSEVSPDIAQIFQDAINKSKTPQRNLSASDFQHPVINLVGNEQQFKGRLPAMNLETHIYSVNKESWLKINGRELKENEVVPNSNVRIEQILPGSLIVEFEGQYIQIPALYEWKG